MSSDIRLASAHPSREFVNVTGVCGETLKPCRLTKARRLVNRKRAEWIDEGKAIQLFVRGSGNANGAAANDSTANSEWSWKNRTNAFYPTAGCHVVLCDDPRVFHKGGRAGTMGFYKCSADELAFLIETEAVLWHRDHWLLVKCPEQFKLPLRKTR